MSEQARPIGDLVDEHDDGELDERRPRRGRTQRAPAPLHRPHPTAERPR